MSCFVLLVRREKKNKEKGGKVPETVSSGKERQLLPAATIVNVQQIFNLKHNISFFLPPASISVESCSFCGINACFRPVVKDSSLEYLCDYR